MKKTFADIAASRKRYNPAVEGYGNPREWVSGFNARLGREEAERVIHNQKRTPREILGVSSSASWGEIKSAYRRLVMKFHPDRNKEPDAAQKFMQVQAAYEVLEALR